MLNLAQAGDNIVSSTDLYGGTWTLFSQTLKQFGIETRFVDPSDPENFRRATDAKTRAYYAEILPNPKLNVFPIREVADIGRSLGVPLIADNTATPLIARPFEHGAAVVVYSATKYIGGHGNSIGGLIVDGGNFPWEQHADRFPLLSQPDDAYHGAIWIEAAKPLGPIAYRLRARVKLLRDIGAALSPFNAFLLLQGLETLPLRLRQHNENAIAVANFLKDRDDVSHVIFPGLQTGESRRRADAYLKGGYGALVGFELKGGVEAGQAVHRRAEALLSRRQYRRRALARHPSRFDHASAAQRRRATRRRRDAWLRAPVGRHRASRGHHRRSRPGARRRGRRDPTRRGAQGRLNGATEVKQMETAMTKIEKPAALSRRNVLKAAGAVGVAASAGALGGRGVLAGDRGPRAENPARLGRRRRLPFAARLRRRQGHLRQAQPRRRTLSRSPRTARR